MCDSLYIDIHDQSIVLGQGIQSPCSPEKRPVKRRQGSRVVVRAGNRILLISDHDPGVNHPHWWVVPGGGVDEGETWREAAVRELYEETGLSIRPNDLVGPVAKRIVTHGYSDKVLIQDERFFLVDVDCRFDPSAAGFTPSELQTLGRFQWFTPSELQSVRVWPKTVVELCGIRAIGGRVACIDWGETEESTVPVSLGYSR